MPLPPDATDADLASRAASGDHHAVDALWARHADAVHDHVARWSGDADLAAAATAAAFSHLLDELATGTVPAAVLPLLLETARSHVLVTLADTGATPGTPVPPGSLVRTTDEHTTPAAAAAAWGDVVALGPPDFSVLDLRERRGLTTPDLAAVLALPAAAVEELVAAVVARTDDATRAAYAALDDVPAPVAARTLVATAATARLGRPLSPRRVLVLRAVAALGAFAVVALGIGVAASTGRRTPAPAAAGVETAAAEPVTAPSPSTAASPSPTPTPTLAPLDEDGPSTTPEPTDPPEPSPSPTIPASPEPLTVAIEVPGSGDAFDATEQDAVGRQVARVPVAATVGGAEPATSVVWTSDLAPDAVLLDGSAGELLLWLDDPCQDTQHQLDVTATDATGRTATASVAVLARETCADPVAVEIIAPSGGTALAATATDAGFSVTFDVAAEPADDGLAWGWGVDTGTLATSPDGPTGPVQVILDTCTEGQRLTLRVNVERTADEATATDNVAVTVADCPSG
jgi:hypothetical protein